MIPPSGTLPMSTASPRNPNPQGEGPREGGSTSAIGDVGGTGRRASVPITRQAPRADDGVAIDDDGDDKTYEAQCMGDGQAPSCGRIALMMTVSAILKQKISP